MRYKLDLAAMAQRIATAVRRLRKVRGWTQEELGAKIQKHRTTIHAIEKGERDHDHQTIQAIADVFGVAIGEITGESAESSGLSHDALQIAQWFDSLKTAEDRGDVMRIVRRYALGPPSDQQ